MGIQWTVYLRSRGTQQLGQCNPARENISGLVEGSYIPKGMLPTLKASTISFGLGHSGC